MGQIQEEADAHDEEIYRIMQEESNEEMYMNQAYEDDINAGKLIFPE